jgi:orotidine-5'-phosphate decarboxylase
MAHMTPATTARTVPIIALDVPTADAALALVDQLGDACRFYKVGNELFTAVGPEIVRRLVRDGIDVFLDLKFHDIPNTVAGGVRNVAALGARLVTVHATGGRAMLAAAVRGAAEESGERCGVLAVTVLTSLDPRRRGRTGSSAAGGRWPPSGRGSATGSRRSSPECGGPGTPRGTRRGSSRRPARPPAGRATSWSAGR